MENSELSGDPDSQQQHFFEIGNSHSNSSGINTNLIQRLYMLFSSGELMMQDKKEAHSEEITSQQMTDKMKKVTLSAEELTSLKYLCLDFPW